MKHAGTNRYFSNTHRIQSTQGSSAKHPSNAPSTIIKSVFPYFHKIPTKNKGHLFVTGMLRDTAHLSSPNISDMKLTATVSY